MRRLLVLFGVLAGVSTACSGLPPELFTRTNIAEVSSEALALPCPRDPGRVATTTSDRLSLDVDGQPIEVSGNVLNLGWGTNCGVLVVLEGTTGDGAESVVFRDVGLADSSDTDFGDEIRRLELVPQEVILTGVWFARGDLASAAAISTNGEFSVDIHHANSAAQTEGATSGVVELNSAPLDAGLTLQSRNSGQVFVQIETVSTGIFTAELDPIN